MAEGHRFSGPGRARALLREAVGRVCPAAVVEVGTASAPLWREAFGTLTYEPGARPALAETVFDLASLTKVVATTTLAMRLVEQGRLSLAEPVSGRVSCWRGGPEQATVEDLLAHAAGLPGTRPVYERASGKAAVAQAICEVPLEYPPRRASCYSDLGFILLGFIVEAAGRGSLDSQFEELAREAGWELQFGIGQGWRERTAPTQVDEWRGRLLQGEVDDRNAAALGGVAGHAGLFGTAEGVGAFAREILNALGGGGSRLAARETVARFVRRVGTPDSTRALGWDTMLPTSSCGTKMSPEAFGHTGFTGTSLWIDPAVPIYVVLLTNRVHPSAGPIAPIQELRRAVHDAVMDQIRGWGLGAGGWGGRNRR